MSQTKITNQAEKEEAIQRVAEISKEFREFNSSKEELQTEIANAEEEKKRLLEEVNQQIAELKSKLKELNDSHKTQLKPLQAELETLKRALGEYEVEAAMKEAS